MSVLRERMLAELRIRNYAPETQRHYVARVARVAQHFHKSPELLGPEEIRSYQVHLVDEKKCSWTVLNQTVLDDYPMRTGTGSEKGDLTCIARRSANRIP